MKDICLYQSAKQVNFWKILTVIYYSLIGMMILVNTVLAFLGSDSGMMMGLLAIFFVNCLILQAQYMNARNHALFRVIGNDLQVAQGVFAPVRFPASEICGIERKKDRLVLTRREHKVSINMKSLEKRDADVLLRWLEERFSSFQAISQP